MIYLFLATICFSFSFGLIKSQITGLAPDCVVFFRLVFAGIIFLPFFLCSIKKLKLKNIVFAALIGIIQYGIMYACFLRAFRYLQGNEIVLLTASTPMFVIIFSSIFSKKIDLRYFLCVIIAICGALIVATGTTAPKFLLRGVIFMETANITFALGQILWKKYIYEKTENLIAISYFSAACCVLPFALLDGLTNFSASKLQWLSILYLGTIPTGIGFWLWNKGAQKVSDVLLSVMNNLKIPFGVIFAMVIFHEKTNPITFIIGSSLLIFAVIYSFTLNKNN